MRLEHRGDSARINRATRGISEVGGDVSIYFSASVRIYLGNELAEMKSEISS